ncbi:MAG: DUF4012 domain-containing protein [Dehalococcoidia bacterium]
MVALVCLMLLGLGAAALVGREAAALRTDAVAGEAELRAARDVLDGATAGRTEFRLTEAQLATARGHLDRALVHIDAAGIRATRLRPVLRVAARGPAPLSGAGEIEPLLATSRALTLSGRALTEALGAFVRRAGPQAAAGDGGEPAGRRLATAFAESAPLLAQALADLDQARAHRRSINDARLQGPLAPARAGLAELDREWASLDADLADLTALAPAARVVLGMDGPRTYAILGQNSAEIRPTGGFIGSLGLITLDQGRVVHQEYRSSYSFDNPALPVPPAPAPIARHIGGGGWALRDANWSPDVPTTARSVEDFLAYNQGIRVDGVIAFDTFAVGGLLRALGPIAVPGFPEPVTTEQWYELASELIYGDPNDTLREQEENKGLVLGPMLRAVTERLQSATAEEQPNVLRALRTAFEERHILAFFHDQAPAALARRHDADGLLGPEPGVDLVYVVDANLSYSKVGGFIRQRIHFETTLNARAAPVENAVTVTYENTLTPDGLRRDRLRRIAGYEYEPEVRGIVNAPGILGTYLRLYAPAASRLTATDPPILPAQQVDAGLLSLGRYVRVPPGQGAAVTYRYRPPAGLTAPGRYRARIVKQPGTEGHELSVRISLPPGATVTAMSPQLRHDGDALVYDGRLTRTLELNVTLAP